MNVLFHSLLLSVNSQFSCENIDSSYKIGDNVTICIYLSDKISNTSEYLALKIKVDEYSGVRLNNSYKYIHNTICATINTTTNITINNYTYCPMIYTISIASDNNISSIEAPYIDYFYVASVFSLVITLDNGKIALIQ